MLRDTDPGILEKKEEGREEEETKEKPHLLFTCIYSDNRGRSLKSSSARLKTKTCVWKLTNADFTEAQSTVRVSSDQTASGTFYLRILAFWYQ